MGSEDSKIRGFEDLRIRVAGSKRRGFLDAHFAPVGCQDVSLGAAAPHKTKNCSLPSYTNIFHRRTD